MRRILFSIFLLPCLLPALAKAQDVALFPPVLPEPPAVITVPPLVIPHLVPPLPAVKDVALSWKSDATVTRSTFVASIMRRLFKPSERCFPHLSPSDYSLLFPDVPKDATYGVELCTAMEAGFISGYTDGTFRPEQPITVAEASKFLAKLFDLASDPLDPATPWSAPFVSALKSNRALPPSSVLNSPLTRVQLSDMLDVLRS